MQNHLLQAFTFCAMEIPATMSAEDILRAKVELLEAVETLSLDDAFLGQFTASPSGNEPGYIDDPTVPAGSRCPTFASIVLHVNSKRWRGVPFVMRAGKGLDERLCEVRMRMKPRGQARRVALGAKADGSDANELVMRIQPDEALYMNMLCKEPGLGQKVAPTRMDMTYAEQFKGSYAGDAYERMFLNAVRGDQSLFVSAAELTEAWRIFTPLLHAIDERQPQPVLYPFGVESPAGYKEWVSTRVGSALA
uniref:glucose-6-phosphate dehydrogenase (NADP(+)) n=1 Tax=Haptolina brevifila TaxID=156173 RepID=A0A7S2NSK0_9EUKA|mmetsp:Transcript_8987/g.18272  ORF Transcript_8987/g.18272 Transcript_8987/m.18272 type:complete len:250 (+) Transcript_8987:739-1488(+)